MNYSYKFDKEKCWYKNVCPHYDQGCRSGCVRFMKMHFLVNNALLTEKQQHPIKLYVEEIDKQSYLKLNDIKHNIRQYVEDGNNLLIYSSITGNGKTQWMLKLLMSYFNAVWAEDDFSIRGLFINVPRFFNELKENISKPSEYVEHIKKYVLDAPMVVWDEIGVKNLTPYEHDYLLSYINARLDAGRSNMFTSNLNKEQLLEVLGDRLYSRVINSSDIIELKGKDKRGIK